MSASNLSFRSKQQTHPVKMGRSRLRKEVWGVLLQEVKVPTRRQGTCLWTHLWALCRRLTVWWLKFETRVTCDENLLEKTKGWRITMCSVLLWLSAYCWVSSDIFSKYLNIALKICQYISKFQNYYLPTNIPKQNISQKGSKIILTLISRSNFLKSNHIKFSIT